jgi:hypothetical protein
VAQLMRDGMTRMIIGPVSETLGVPDARLRVGLVASQLVGIALVRYLLELDPVTTTPTAELIDRIAPALQHYLTG